MLDTSKFKDYIAGITDNEKPTSNVFLLEGTIRALTGLSSACEAEETKDKRGELFEQQVLVPLCNELQKSGNVHLIPQKEGQLFIKESLDRCRDGYRFVWQRSI